MEITHEQRLEILKSYNDLRNALQTLDECQDLWVSDVNRLQTLEFVLRTTLKFTRSMASTKINQDTLSGFWVARTRSRYFLRHT